MEVVTSRSFHCHCCFWDGLSPITASSLFAADVALSVCLHLGITLPSKAAFKDYSLRRHLHDVQSRTRTFWNGNKGMAHSCPHRSSWHSVAANNWLLIKSMSDSEEPSIISEEGPVCGWPFVSFSWKWASLMTKPASWLSQTTLKFQTHQMYLPSPLGRCFKWEVIPENT